jgi:hypothetical protein
LYPAAEKRYAAVLQYIVEKREEGGKEFSSYKDEQTTELICFIVL